MKKISIMLSYIFVLLGTSFFLNQNKVLAESLTNTEIAKNILVENGYSNLEAEQDLKGMIIQDEGELIGIDICSKSENNTTLFRAASIPTTTQYLSHNAVKDIYSNFRNAITRAYHQGKRVKIVTEYRGSMSLNRNYYYVVN